MFISMLFVQGRKIERSIFYVFCRANKERKESPKRTTAISLGTSLVTTRLEGKSLPLYQPLGKSTLFTSFYFLPCIVLFVGLLLILCRHSLFGGSKGTTKPPDTSGSNAAATTGNNAKASR